MFGADKGKSKSSEIESSQLGRKLYIGVVQARFNADITAAMLDVCLQQLQALGVDPKHITTLQVPGALEIPVALQAMAEKDEYDALIAIGCIIRGETYHFELVANESARGITHLSLDYGLPILNAILTVENTQQAQARVEEKARDAAQGAVEMALLINEWA